MSGNVIQPFEVFSKLKKSDPLYSSSKNKTLVYEFGQRGLKFVAYREDFSSKRSLKKEIERQSNVSSIRLF